LFYIQVNPSPDLQSITMTLIAMTFIKIPTEPMAAALIILSFIKISADSMSTTLSIMTPTKKSTELIIKDMHPNFIVY